MKKPFFLTEVAQDWPDSHLSTVRDIIREAEQAMLLRSNEKNDPLLDTPNLPNFRGILRWVMVQKHFELAVAMGRLPGITAVWVDLGGSHTLELHGKYTIVTPCHLLRENEAPRETSYRREGRQINEVCPLLKGFEAMEKDKAADKLRLLLVHGGKKELFAYLRAYIDESNPAIYRPLSKNIMLMPALLPTIDFEPVVDPTVALAAVKTQQAEASGQ